MTEGATSGTATGTDPSPIHTTTSWWASTSGDAAAPSQAAAQTQATDAPAGEGPTPERAPAPSAPPPDLAAAAADLGRALTDERTGRGRWRFVQAVVGWLPILFGVGWLVGELTGCGRFAATCDAGFAAAATPIISLTVLAVLCLVPALASIAATAALAMVVAAVPTALVLSAGGDATELAARAQVLGAILVLAWIAGLVIAIVRRVRPVGTRAGPVS